MTEPRRIRMPFREDMYVASVERRKTETRRVLPRRHQPVPGSLATGFAVSSDGRLMYDDNPWRECASPYGEPGDLLGLIEPFRVVSRCEDIGCNAFAGVVYKWHGGGEQMCVVPASHADKPAAQIRCTWLSGRYMPLWAVRRWAVNRGDRVENVQDITWQGAMREGTPLPDVRDEAGLPMSVCYETHGRMAFRRLWDEINGPRGYGWDANPSVRVVSYTMEENHE